MLFLKQIINPFLLILYLGFFMALPIQAEDFDEGASEDDFLGEEDLDLDEEVFEDDTGSFAEILNLRLKIKQRYRIQPFYRDTNSGEFDMAGVLENRVDRQLLNFYGVDMTFPTSDHTYHHYEYTVHFFQEFTEERYKESFGAAIQQAYVNHQNGAHHFRGGLQIVKMGKIDVDSPIDILNKKEGGTFNMLSNDELKKPLPAFKYQWIGKTLTSSLYLAPIKLDTPGDAFSRARDDLKQLESDKGREDQHFIQGHWGAKLSVQAGDLNMQFGAFQWSDPDNFLQFLYTSPKASLLSPVTKNSALKDKPLTENFVEHEDTIRFATFEMDYPFSGFSFKMDVGIFENKNFYHLNTDGKVADVSTVTSPMTAVATSLERRIGNWFVMPVVTYRFLSDVPEFSHLFFYENREEPADFRRDLDLYQYHLVNVFQIRDRLTLSFNLFDSSPVKKSGYTMLLSWKTSDLQSTWRFFLTQALLEKQLMTDSAVEITQAYVEYLYEF